MAWIPLHRPVMMASHPAPLADSLDFLAKLDEDMAWAPRWAGAAPLRTATVDDLSPDPAPDDDDDLGRQTPWFMPLADQPQLASVSPIAAAAGFVIMMAVGAAGAALVFHDRLALLLR